MTGAQVTALAVAAFKPRWRAWYGDVPPVAHLMRVERPDLWFRIHSLASSERYPGTDEEWSELLLRQNAVASAALGDPGEGVMVTLGFPEPAPALREAELQPVEMDASWAIASSLRDAYDETRVKMWVGPFLWRAGAHDWLVRAAAEDRTGPLLVAALRTGNVYAPYDGGADLFFRDATERARARQEFRKWFSSRPSGL